MRLVTGAAHGTPLIRIEGDVDSVDAPALKRAVWDAFAGGDTQIVLDLEACTHLSSTALAVFFSLTEWVRAKQGRVMGICPSSDILRLFQLVRLTDERSFQLFIDLESARETILSGRPVIEPHRAGTC